MAGARKPAMVSRGTIFVLAENMVTAEAWAAAHGLDKDKYRYVVNETVLDIWGPNDTYAPVAGLDQAGERYIKLMAIVRERNLEWCGKDPYILVRGENGRPAPREVTVSLPQVTEAALAEAASRRTIEVKPQLEEAVQLVLAGPDESDVS